MTRNKDRKRIIRSRMKKAGESYTAARAQVIAKQNVKQTPARTIDYAKLAGMSDDKVAAQTGRTWEEWTRVLDRNDAAAMAHRDIAVLVHK
jgi:trans-2-enoyl-CoA reductase